MQPVPALQVLPALKVPQVPLALQELQDRKEPPDHKALLEWVLQVPQALQDPQALVLLVLLAPQATQD